MTGCVLLVTNPAMIQVMRSGSCQQVKLLTINNILILSTQLKVVQSAHDLGVTLDSPLSLSYQVLHSGFYQLHQLCPPVWSLTADATKTLIQAFVSCHLDYYCNSLQYSISDSLIRKLQSVQSSPAHLITGARQCYHITPVLQQLYLLPVKQWLTIRWHAWYTSHCWAMHLGTWLTTSTLSPTAVITYFNQHLTGRMLYCRHTPALATEAPTSVHLMCGTLCHGHFYFAVR